jgi:trehalose/maltose hydrolase-like predicted phosphorylase
MGGGVAPGRRRGDHGRPVPLDRLSDDVAGRTGAHESNADLPDWQFLTVRIEDGDWLDLAALDVTGYVQELDPRRGVLTRRFTVEDPSGRRTRVAQRRLVSMADSFLAALDCTVVAENWSGRLTVRSGLDGRVTNGGVARYRGLSGRHLVGAEATSRPDLLGLVVRTVQSHVRIGLAARHRVLLDGAEHAAERRPAGQAGVPAVDLGVDLAPGRVLTVEKVVALCTSGDRAISDPGEAAVDEVRRAPDLDVVLAQHVRAWARLWHRCDLESDGPPQTSLVLRLHVFHLLQSVSPHSIDLDVGIPARGLHVSAAAGSAGSGSAGQEQAR